SMYAHVSEDTFLFPLWLHNESKIRQLPKFVKMTVKEEEATLVDYFVVTGYDPEAGLVVEQPSDGVWGSDSGPEAFRTPLQRSFIPKIIEYFPKKRRNCPFSPEIISLCMPKGLRFYTEKCVPQRPQLHTFANIREDGSRVNGAAITFYEEVTDPAVRSSIAILQQEHVRKVTGADRNDLGREHIPPGTVSGGTHTLPRGRRNVGKRISYYDGGGQDTLFMSKTLCLISRLPIVGGMHTLLQLLFQVASNEDMSGLPLESYIYWMLNEVPLPSPGTTLKLRLVDDVMVVQRPTHKELPFFDYPLTSLFQIITVEKFVRIWTAFLLEHQIIVCSKDISRLMLVSESLCALSFPFRWQLTYVPILPNSQLKFIEAPVPYVMGICTEDGVPECLYQCNVCILDLDSSRVEIPEDLPFFPDHKQLVAQIKSIVAKYTREPSQTIGESTNGEEERTGIRISRSFDFSEDSPRFEELLQNNSALARVAEIARRAGVNVNGQLDSLKEELNEKKLCIESRQSRSYFHEMRANNAIRQCFAWRMAIIFKSYEQFVLGSSFDRDDDNRESVVSFDKAGFMADHKLSYLPFLAAFLETQMFTSFIDSKLLYGITVDENIYILDGMIGELKGMEDVDLANVEPMRLQSSHDLIVRREEQLDYVVSPPHSLPCAIVNRKEGEIWRTLDASLLTINDAMSPMPSPWKQRYARLKPKTIETVRPISTYGTGGMSTDNSDHHNAKFVEQLLKETKGKTKRMLVEKMGAEAVELGHGDGLRGVEENTLVASLCDLLERIFSHGHTKKHGKSSFWTILLSHEEGDKLVSSRRSSSHSYLAPVIRPYPGVSSMVSSPSFPSTSSTTSTGRLRRTTSSLLPPPPPPASRIAPSSPPTRPPPPVPPHSSTMADVSNLLAGMDVSSSDGDDWKSSLFKAANSLAEKLASGLEGMGERMDRDMKIEERKAEGGTGVSGGVSMLISRMKKSPSFSDFTSPSWATEDGNRNAREARRETSRTRDASARRRSSSRNGSPDTRYILRPISTSISYDLKNVLRMCEMKSELGYARAFVRLALERRLLHKHLQTIMTNHKLISDNYKPYAFVRQEEEREQFLMHIMSLNAAKFRCFTNTFTKTRIDYQVIISTGPWSGFIPPIWLMVYGSHGESTKMPIANTTKTFRFEHCNLGILSSLRIGHGLDKPPKWYLENMVIRNEVTGARYYFPCGRWFGRGVDDGGLERLLIANILTDETRDITGKDSGPGQDPPSRASPALRRGRASNSRGGTPLRDRSPSIGRTLHKCSMKAEEIEEMLGEVVNALIRHLHAHPEGHNTAEFVTLLHGSEGLIDTISLAFQCGRSDGWSGRLLRGIYPWDYIEKVGIWMEELTRSSAWKNLDMQRQQMILYTLKLVHRINEKEQLGKESKFHVFVLVSIRDHSFCGLLSLMAWTPVTQNMYDTTSFIRNSYLLSRFSKLLDALSEFPFHIDQSLTHGIV
ncbi:hypothetical protein PMAYCL1PPCAC_06828, partial [Pristionchus mayeri]